MKHGRLASWSSLPGLMRSAPAMKRNADPQVGETRNNNIAAMLYNNVAAMPCSKTKVLVAGKTCNNNNNNSKATATPPCSKSTTKVAAARKPKPLTDMAQVSNSMTQALEKSTAARRDMSQPSNGALAADYEDEENAFQPGVGVVILVGKYKDCLGDIDKSFDPDIHTKPEIPILIHPYVKNGTLVQPCKQAYYPYQLKLSED